jgi:MoaA/NifB/PqqE/SkfB family radical SAM enzyme
MLYLVRTGLSVLLIKSMPQLFCTNVFFRKTLRNDTNLPCCWLPAGTDIAQVQNSMSQGMKPQQCSACWRLEDSGLPSKRTIDNQDFVELSGLSIEKLSQQTLDPQHLAYQIKLSNHCNLACKTCYPQDSTGWYREYNQWHTVKFQDTFRADSKFLESVDFEKARVIEFLGGEPLLHPDHAQVLQRLLSAGNTKCRLIYTTNGTRIPSNGELELLKQFDNVWFNFSIDGVGPVFEYLRYPASWDQVNNNIETIQGMGFNVSCVHLLSNLNIARFDEFLIWALKMFGVGRVSVNYVRDYPAYFQPHVLHEDVKQQIIEKWQGSRLWPLLKAYQSLLEPKANKFTIGRFIINCLRQDSYRKQCISNVLPEIVFFDDSRPLRKRLRKV